MADYVEAKILDITGGPLASQGYEINGFAIEYFKDDLFSDAHNILQTFLFNPPHYDYSWNVEFTADHDASEHPDVYQAWTIAGGEPENLQTVAKLPELGKWGVGFGGKKNGERAAKLALAASIAMDSELTAKVIQEYPKFGDMLNVATGGEAPAGGGSHYGSAKGSSKVKSARASPYGEESWDAGWEMGMKLVETLGGKGGKASKSGGKKGKLLAMLGEMMGMGDMGDDAWGGDGGKTEVGGKGWGGDEAGGKGKAKGKGKKEKAPVSEAWQKLNSLPNDTKIWVGNLPQDTTTQTLEEHFGLIGTVAGATMMGKAQACVAYATAEEAAQAIELLNMSEIGDQQIKVDVWTAK